MNLFSPWQFCFGHHGDFRPIAQFIIVLPQFFTNKKVVFNGIAAISWYRLDEMNEDPATFNVLEEFMSKSGSGMSTFDQPRDISHDKRAIHIDLHLPQVGKLGRKWIVGNFGSGVSDATQQRALARVWFSDQPDIGDYFKLHQQSSLFTVTAGRFAAWCLVRGRLKVCISFASLTPLGRHNRVTFVLEVLENEPIFGINDDGSRWNVNRMIFTRSAMPIRTLAMLTASGSPLFFLREGDETVNTRLGNDVDASPLAPISTVGTALGNISFPTKAHAPVATLAAGDFNFYAIDKHYKLDT